MVEGGRHSGPAVEVLSACAGDRYSLAEERTLGADFLVELLQGLGCYCVSSCKGPLVEVPGLRVGLGGTITKLVAYAQNLQCRLRLEFCTTVSRLGGVKLFAVKMCSSVYK